eukprot:6197156-Pleurochrysis_carterae.AAC.10
MPPLITGEASRSASRPQRLELRAYLQGRRCARPDAALKQRNSKGVAAANLALTKNQDTLCGVEDSNVLCTPFFILHRKAQQVV